MEPSEARRVVPFPTEDSSLETNALSLGLDEYETLSRAFQKFSEASLQLQSKYEELKRESQGLRRELEKKEIEIKRSERLATLGETAAALAHEIRNPLGAISLYTSLLKEDLSEQPEQHELVSAIDKSVTTLNHVVSNILHFAKSSTPVLAPASLGAILGEICAQYRAVHREADIQLQTRGNLYVWGDETGLRQLFSNLLLNALQAQQLRGFVQVVAVSGRDEIFVRVRDNGPGIPIQYLGSIFEPFTTSKPEGTGLGLAICQQIATLHRARLTAGNRRNGAQFTIAFQKASEGSRK
ncbi:MAG: hypothetical protein KDD70_07710 [Bdellovibrionales bacterium]|nr:hypothetical protein [Bdellovibrionales bacterium]